MGSERTPNLYPYLTSPLDIALCNATPTLVAPVHGRLPPPLAGEMRFVVSRRGLHLEARSRAVEMRFLVAKAECGLPYGDVADGIRLVNGPIPGALFREALGRSAKSMPDEWAGLVVWDEKEKRYRLVEPDAQSVSDSHIAYDSRLPSGFELVLDLHSHGTDPAFFSDTDDQSDDGGIYLAGVIGHCDRERPALCFRAVAHGRFSEFAPGQFGGP
jgi:PRTRC genetic system protein A